MEKQTILKLEDITKIYPNGIVANKDINIEFTKGEIHSIVGENGAGKSTLMKVIFGIEHANQGKMIYKGKEVHFNSSMDAIENKIGMVHQHFMLIPSFTVTQNIVLGSEPKKGAYIDYDKANQICQDLAKKYKFDLDVTQKVGQLTVSAKQKVEILKTLYRQAEVIILDEPTAVLTPQETKLLFEQLVEFKKAGHTIVFISHKLQEVKEISDRITVIRNGETKGTYDNVDISLAKLTELIIGRKLETSYDHLRQEVKEANTVLHVNDLSYFHHGVKKFADVNFSIKQGEILGIAGVQGNGQEELIKSLTGLIEGAKGSVKINQKEVNKFNIRQRRDAGMSYIPEDRMVDGTAANASITDNLISTYYERNKFSGKIFLKGKAIRQEAKHLISKFSVKTKSEANKISNLSGGNIQKVVVAREWNTNPSLMIAEQPTRGIDIGSANYIHHRLIEMRNNGSAILLVSADLNEIISVSDRLLVIDAGEIVAYFPTLKGVNENMLGLYMLGVEKMTPEEIKEAVYDN